MLYNLSPVNTHCVIEQDVISFNMTNQTTVSLKADTSQHMIIKRSC